MADFMSVLAASQKPTHSGIQGKALAALLPGGAFESVLAAQFESATEGEALTLLSSDEFTLEGKLAAKKPQLTAVADPDKAVEFAALPLAVARDVEAEKSAPEILPGARPALVRTALEGAASPAASRLVRGQDLPQSTPLPRAVDGQIAALPEGGEALLSQIAMAVPAEGAKPLDQAAAATARQLGQFEQMARVPETRVQAAVETPVRSQGFAAELSDKIVWLAGRQSQVADLSLNPPHLGTLEVRLSLAGGEAGAQFYSPHPAVRDAIEAALPRLRELMAQAGIALGDAQVRDEAFFARRDAGAPVHAGGESSSEEAMAPLAAVGNIPVRAGLGLVDLYI